MKTTWPAIRCGCLLLATTGLLTSSVATQAQKPAGAAQGSAAAAVISSVAVTQTAERASVRVEGEGLLEARATRMDNPPRLVLDFSDTRLAVHRTDVPGVSSPVRGVRLGQYKHDVARVVIDLSAATPYQITHDGSALVISFQGSSQAPADNAVNLTTTAAAAVQPALRRSSFHFVPPAPRSKAAVRTMNVATPKFRLPRELTQPTQVLASWSRQTAVPERPAQTSGAAVAASRYTGEPISVNLKDVDLRDFFRLIHEISGLNVILDPAVKGSLTIVLDEVPWDQALDLVLQNNSLDKQITGNVLRIATRDALKREAEVSRDLQKAQQEAVDPVTVTRVLSYAKAEKLTGTLKKFLSPRGDILADDRSNQLIIRDIPSTIPVIDNLIRQLDRKSQQVEIEARVVSASRSFAQDIGVQL